MPPLPADLARPSRRALLWGLAGAAACTHTPAPLVGAGTGPRSGEAVRLGWRLAPGQELPYQVTLRRLEAGRDTVRQEAWTYLVTQVSDQGTATLDGRLLGLGADLTVGGHPIDAASLAQPRAFAERDTARRVQLQLDADGTLIALTRDRFAQRLPHALLAQAFPRVDLREGDTWADLSLLKPFATLFSPRVPLRTTTRTTLMHLDRPSPGRWHAHLQHHAVFHTASNGPRLELSGSTRWDAHEGRVLDRSFTAVLLPQPAGRPDTLELTLFHRPA